MVNQGPPPNGQYQPMPLAGFQVTSIDETNGQIPPGNIIDISGYVSLPLGGPSAQPPIASTNNGSAERNGVWNRLGFRGNNKNKVPVLTQQNISNPMGSMPKGRISVPIGRILIKQEAYDKIKKETDDYSPSYPENLDPAPPLAASATERERQEYADKEAKKSSYRANWGQKKWQEVGGMLVGRYQLDKSVTPNSYTVIIEGYMPVERDGTLAEFSITRGDFAAFTPRMRQQFPGCILMGIYHSHPNHKVFHSGPDLLALGKDGGNLTEDYQISMVMDPIMDDVRNRPAEVGIFVDNKEIARFGYQKPLNGLQPKPTAQAATPSPAAAPMVQQPIISAPPPLVAPPLPSSKAGPLPGGLIAPPGYVPAPAQTHTPPATTNAGPASGHRNDPKRNVRNLNPASPTPAAPLPVSAAAVPPALDPDIVIAPQTTASPTISSPAPVSTGASIPNLREGIYAKLVRDALSNRTGLHQTPIFALEFSGPGPHDRTAQEILSRLGLHGIPYDLQPLPRGDGTFFGADLLFDSSCLNTPLTAPKVADVIHNMGLDNSVARPWPVPSELIASEYLYHFFQKLFPGSQPVYSNDVAHADLDHTGGTPRIALDMVSGAHVTASPQRATMTTPEDDALRVTIQNAKMGGWNNLSIKTDNDEHFKKTFKAFTDEKFTMDQATQDRAQRLGILSPQSSGGRQPAVPTRTSVFTS